MNLKAQKQKALAVVLWEKGDDRQVLLLKMKPERGGHWQPVTGHVESGESFEAAAIREAIEETGFIFDSTPRYLGMEYEFDGRFGPVIERAFALKVASPNGPPIPKLDPNEHVDFQWCKPAEAIHAVTFPNNREAIYRATHPIPPLQLSKDGVWSQEGEEITHERTRALLYNSVRRNVDGTYCVEVGPDQLALLPEDTAYFVSSYEAETGTLTLLGGKREVLNPDSLEFFPNGTCYCTLKNKERARILRQAYYTLAQQITEEPTSEGKKYFLNFLGRRHQLRVAN